MDLTQLLIQGLIAGILLGSLYSLIGLGMTLIVGVMGIVNFANGALLMLSMYAAYWVFVYTGVAPYALFIVAVPLLFFVGMAIQRGLIKPIIHASYEAQILATVGLSLFLTNFALLMWTADYRSVVTPLSYSSIMIGDVTISIARLIASGLSALTGVALYIFLQRTKMGKAMRATAQDRVLASLLGVNINRIDSIAFGIGSSLAAIAGVLILPIYYVSPTIGDTFILPAFATIVLGGFGNFIGALVGGVIIGIAESLTAVTFSSEFRQVASFLIIILILLYKPEGLFTRRLRE